MIDQREDQIRQRAYELWEQEGRPEGREYAHWDEAARQIGGLGQPVGAGPSEAGVPFEGDGSMPSGNPSVDQLTPSQASAAVTGARGARKTTTSGARAEARTRKPL